MISNCCSAGVINEICLECFEGCEAVKEEI